MLLAIDVGNTNIAFGVFSGKDWLNRWRIRTAPDKMPDEYSVLFRDLLRTEKLDLTDIGKVTLSSVVPSLTETMSTMLLKEMGRKPLVVGPGVKTGIRIRTDNPVEVGTDLVANAVAAYARFQANCIVVDFGTALTLTAVTEPGDLVGVAIAPGLKYAIDALAQRTAQLPHVSLVPPPSAIGKNTVHSIQAGVIFGYVGMVESLIDRMTFELEGRAKVIAIGGQAQVIAPLTDRFNEIEPWLTLEGLRLIAEKNI